MTSDLQIPALGLGTWPLDDDGAERVVAQALEIGYRLVDTAFAYGNEVGVGRGVRASGLPRDQVFITTKFNGDSHSVGGARIAVERSLEKLGTDYVDLVLIHWPMPWQDRYVQAWEGLVAVQGSGLVRHIGVSNFLPDHLDRIIAATGVAPALDQLQINPRWTQPEARAYNAAHGIVTQSWSPLGQGKGLLEVPEIVDLARAQGLTPAQLALAWHRALGLVVVAKSSDPGRLRANLAAVELTLPDDVVSALSAMDGTEPDVLSPLTFGH